ncbi:MAG TPA: hypothetical protein ENH53_04650, partial [Bacteroidetes bacterium]|nr:hypothetical protein [Bacteroidota bacterium]
MKTVFPNPNYPSGSRRNCSIVQVLNKSCDHKNPIIAGRLIEWKVPEKSFWAGQLRDECAALFFRTDENTTHSNFDSLERLRAGDIVEVALEQTGNSFKAKQIRRLAPAQISPGEIRNQSANWVKAVFSEEQKNLFIRRSQIIRQIRRFFLEQGFLEIDAPALVRYPGQEPHLTPFVTSYRTADGAEIPLYLQTSPEFSMKKLLASGLEKIFYLGHSFRREPVSNLHQPEFLMLEWYRAYEDYTSLMRDCEQLLRELAGYLFGCEKISFGDLVIDLSRPFERLTVADALQNYAGLNFNEIRDDPLKFVQAARQKGYTNVDDSWKWDDLFFEIFLNEIEPKLGKSIPTFLIEYPASMGALAHRKKENPDFTERFELYLAGVELANAFTELNDPEEQYGRFLG